jgi:hypothetical protein
MILEDDQKRIRYSHHVAIDELQTDLPMDQRNPASCFLSGQVIDTGHRATIIRELEPLEVTSDCWLPNNMVQLTIPATPLTDRIGIVYWYVPLFGRCRVENLVPDSLAALYLTRYHPKGQFILEINGSPVRTVDEVAQSFRFHIDRSQDLQPLTILLVTMGPGENGPDEVALSAVDRGQLRSVYSVQTPLPEDQQPRPVVPLIFDPGGASFTPFVASVLQTKGVVSLLQFLPLL